SMTTFICGAEPIIPATLEKFVDHYRPARLRPESMVPAYGLAEATLAVTFTPYLRGLLTDSVNLHSLSEQRVAKQLEPDDSHSVRIMSCGLPLPELSVRVAGNDGKPSAPRAVGEIQISGPSVTDGYIGDLQTTEASRTPDGWLRTGDLGYMVDGELYVCGR